MSRVRHLINSFSAGEVSPLLLGRVDLAKYPNACETVENWLPLPYGSAKTRGGFHYVAEVKDSTKAVRLVPFEFSTLQAYILEFGDLYIRFYRDNGRIEVASVPVEIASPYLAADLPQLKFAQSADTLYIVHVDYPPYKLTRTSHTAWTLTAVTFTDGPFKDENTDAAAIITASGSELVINGLFASNITSWADVSVPAGSIAWNAGGYMDLINVAGNKGAARQPITTIAGIVYGMGFTVGGGDLMLRIGSSAGGQQILADTAQTVGAQIVFFTATSATTYLEFSNQTNGTTHTLDSVSVNNALQTGATVAMTAAVATWEAGHVGAFWKFKDAAGFPSYAAWVTATAYAIGDRIVNAGNVYQATTAASSGTVAPVHERGTVSDGGVSWAFINDGSGYVEITSFSTSQSVIGIVRQNLPATVSSGTSFWSEGAWSDVEGYPDSVEFFEQRLVYARDQTVWGSESGAYDGMKAGTVDDQGFIFPIAGKQANIIRWLAALDILLLGTTGAVHGLTGGADAAVTPTNVKVRKQTQGGVADISPVEVANSLIYVQRQGKKVRELTFSFQDNVYVPTDLTLLAEHITGDGLTYIAYQQEPYSIVWGTRSDGQLIALTFLKAQEVVAWSRHPTDGTVESIAVTPTASNDQLWVVANRTINGSTKRYIEYLDEDMNVDCGLTYSGAPATTFTGLTHLVGETVRIVGDNALFPDQVVPASGSITITTAVSTAQIGLPYTCTLKPVRPEVKDGQGTIQTQRKRWAEITVRVKSTRALTVNGQPLSFRGISDPMDAAPPEFTGDMKVSSLGSSKEGQITIVQSEPYPGTVIGLFGVLDSGND